MIETFSVRPNKLTLQSAIKFVDVTFSYNADRFGFLLTYLKAISNLKYIRITSFRRTRMLKLCDDYVDKEL